MTRLDFEVREDVIEVKVFDKDFRTYFAGKANINNKKQMALLIQGLKDKGIDLTTKTEWI